MLFYENILLGFALIIDSFTISISFGLVEKKETILKNMNLIGITCAIGQVFFLFIGWLVGKMVSILIEGITSWVGFILLSSLSIYMIIDALRKRKDSIPRRTNINLKILIFLVFATSFDVISVGITLGLLHEIIILLTIITFIFTYISAYVGGFTGFKIGEKLSVYKGKIIGALLIFFLGCSLLFQNL